MTKSISILLPKTQWWMRWASVVTWLAGFRYFMILAKTDAADAGSPALAWKWIGIWLVSWLIAFGIIMALLRPTEGILNHGWVLGVLIGFIVLATSWLQLSLLRNPAASNRTLCISVGGGLGTIMFFGMCGIVWRCNKRVIAAAKENAAGVSGRAHAFLATVPDALLHGGCGAPPVSFRQIDTPRCTLYEG